MFGTMIKEDRLNAPQYIPTERTFTGCFRIDERVACALKSNPLQASFDACFPLFLDQDFPWRTTAEDSGVILLDVALPGLKPMEDQGVLTNFWFSAFMPPAQPVVFVRQLPALATNTLKFIESAVAPSLRKRQIPAELSTPHSILLRDILASGLWSRRDLKPILGPSHQQIGRIAAGSDPAPEVARRIDELHRFFKRLLTLVHGDVTAMKRLLNEPSLGDGKTAQDWLRAQDFKKALSAIIDAATPALNVTETESLPLRWYDEPSVAIEDLDQRR
jgi:hypothetical protein